MVSVYMCLRYMLLGGAVDLWMLHLGRFLTGVAGGMTAASIPVGYRGHRIFLYQGGFFVPQNTNVTPFLITLTIIM